ncbi:MAG: DUF2797 domain-containing protein [Methanobacteriota archaeon]|nr:MAG: DUF2797 domain-containing protein [Euryarchaeota archaeon]
MVEFGWGGYEPHLVCVDRSDDSTNTMDLDDVDYIFSELKMCTGFFEEGRHKRCPDEARVSRFSQCANCAEESFIPYQECVFEPKCDGELCDVDFCKREHVLYLAFYNTRVKIGMSSTRRLEERLIEQGADAYALIASLPTRRRTRTAEKEISARLRIPQAFRQRTLLDDFTKHIDPKSIEDQFTTLAASLEKHFDMRPDKLRWLDSYPIELPIDRKPLLRETPGRHRGELVGIKGKWLIYRSDAVYALSLADAPARYVGRGRG